MNRGGKRAGAVHVGIWSRRVIGRALDRARRVSLPLALLVVLTRLIGQSQGTHPVTPDQVPPGAEASAQVPTTQVPPTPVAPGETPTSWPSPVEDNRILTYWNFEQLEGRTNGPNSSFRWDGQGWIGTDFNKVWFKSEGRVAGGTVSDGDHEVLYDRPIPRLRYLDWQGGVRMDVDSGPTRVWAALGVEGLAPYFFDIEPTLYVRDGGNVAGRFSGLYNLRITQRLILQPQIELNFYSGRDPARGVGAGLSNLDSGVRLGYQISRKFAPYIGFTYTDSYGETARFARQSPALMPCSRCFVFGVWVWR